MNLDLLCQHSLFCDNCHSHVACALNLMKYKGSSSLNMYKLHITTTFICCHSGHGAVLFVFTVSFAVLCCVLLCQLGNFIIVQQTPYKVWSKFWLKTIFEERYTSLSILCNNCKTIICCMIVTHPLLTCYPLFLAHCRHNIVYFSTLCSACINTADLLYLACQFGTTRHM